MTFDNAALFEHRFWLQIMGDHSRFIFNSLSPGEREAIQTAQHFISVFDQLLVRARQPLAGAQLMALTQQAHNQVKELRDFKLELIRRHLVGQAQIHLTPTFLNHMLNELDEYLRILDSLLLKQQIPVFNPVHLHLLWLLDAAGHSFYLAASLDEVEKMLIHRSIDFNKIFKDLHDKALEMGGYLRTGLKNFPALNRLNNQAEKEIQLFSGFLLELQQLILSNKALLTLTPLVTDHMLREDCYYLINLALVSEISTPNCDPTKPRIQV